MTNPSPAERACGPGLPQLRGQPRGAIRGHATAAAGVGETAVYVGEGFRGRGVDKSLLRKQVTAADEAGLWTLQTSIFPENRASLALHQGAGCRTLGVRECTAQHHGVWRDTAFVERRSAAA